jgi:Zn-dependent peptidase ImmA (M78 family)
MSERIHLNPKRLVWCCEQYRITLEELARDTKLKLEKLKDALDGKPAFTFRQLQTISKYFGRGVLFFLQPGEPSPEAVYSPQFRRIGPQKPDLSIGVKKIIQRAEVARQTYIGLLEQISEPTPDFSPPERDGRTLREYAALVREWLGFGRSKSNFVNFRHAVESKGVMVIRSNGYAGDWQVPKGEACGFALYHKILPLIFVTKQNHESRQSFTLFHELAHILLHRDSKIDESADLREVEGVEAEANRFASYILVPRNALDLVSEPHLPPRLMTSVYAWLGPAMAFTGASADTILLRLAEEGRIDRAFYDSFSEWRDLASVDDVDDDAKGTRLYRHREPIHIFGDRYVRTVLTALSSRDITLERATRNLDGISVQDVHKLESYASP